MKYILKLNFVFNRAIDFQSKADHEKLKIRCSGKGYLGYIHFYEKQSKNENRLKISKEDINWLNINDNYEFNGDFEISSTIQELNHFNIYFKTDENSNEWIYLNAFYGYSFEIRKLMLSVKNVSLRISSVPFNYYIDIQYQ